MDNWNNQGGPPSAQNPPPYSEKHPYHQQPPPVDGPANPAMPTQYQAYYASYGVVASQGAIIQPPQQTTFIVPVQPTHEPDYLVYSILTMIFCCLPLGIAALVFSIQAVSSSVCSMHRSKNHSQKLYQQYDKPPV